jgi:hypothetical protein
VLLLLALLLALVEPLDALVFPVEKRAARLALVIPFTQRDSLHVITNLKRWQVEGDPCPMIKKYEAKHYVDIIFWYHMDFHSNETYAAAFRLEARQELKWMRGCFGRSKFLSSHLTLVEDMYPQGPSNQFYKLFANDVEGLSGLYDYFMLMEHDVRVIRPGWLDAIWKECAFPTEFYIKGSILRGRRCAACTMLLLPRIHAASSRPRADPNLNYEQCSSGWLDSLAWIGHINGNGLYRLGNPHFHALINDTMKKWDPNTGWKAFDTSIWRNLVTNYMTNWASYQTYAHMLQYSQFIQNWSEEITDEITASIRANFTDTFLIHGSAQSQGDAKNNPLLGLSVEERDALLKARNEGILKGESGGKKD